MKKYRVGVIGHTGRGNYGHGVDTVWAQIPEQCEVVAVADADEKGLGEAVKRLSSAERKVARSRLPTTARCSTRRSRRSSAIGPRWLDQHRDMVLAAAERGMHIYMEKPMCRTLAEADEMVAACEKHDVKLALAHQTRYSPKLQAIRDLIDGRQAGHAPGAARPRQGRPTRGGGEDLWVLGSHVMNLIHHFGGDPTWCFARVEEGGKPVDESRRASPATKGSARWPATRSPRCTASTAARPPTSARARGTGGGKGRFGLQIYGSKGIVEILTGHLPSVQFLADPAWSPGRSKAQLGSRHPAPASASPSR